MSVVSPSALLHEGNNGLDLVNSCVKQVVKHRVLSYASELHGQLLHLSSEVALTCV